MHDELLARWEKGHTGAAIARHLASTFGPRAPHENTVYAEIRRHASDRSGTWTLADDGYDPAAARLVLEELAAIDVQSGGRRRHFTRREAWWVARLKSIHNAGTEGWTALAPGEAFRMAVLHTGAEQRGEQLSAWLDTIEAGLAHLHVAVGNPARFAPKEEGK